MSCSFNKLVKKTISCLLIPALLIILNKKSFSQFENTDVGARATGLNGAFTSLSDNSLAVYYNPSGLGQMKYREFSFYYSPAPYALTELSTATLTYSEPFSFGTFGLGIKTYGYDLYRETGVTVSYGNSFKKKIFYGLNLNYYNLKIKNYGSDFTFGIDAGAMAYITNFLKWGFFARNITNAKIGQSKEKLAQVYRTGFTIQPRSDINFILELEKDVRYNLSLRAGFEYSIIDFVDLRAGVGSEPTAFSGGIGFYYSLFQIDYALNHTQDLGFTHQVTFSVNFGGLKGKKESREQLKKAFE